MSPSIKGTDPFQGISGTLENLADRISEFLKCPITIEDANHRLLAYSTHDERTDPARIATIIGRRVPEKVINSLWKEGVIPALLETDEPIRVKKIDEIGLGNRIAISIWKNKEVLGYIWALEIDQSLKDNDLEILKKAAKAVKNHLLQLQTRKNINDEGYQELFWQLLTGHLNSTEDIINKFNKLQIKPPSLISTLVFRFPTEIDQKIEKQIFYILKTTQQIRIIFHTFDCTDLILLAAPLTQGAHGDFINFILTFQRLMQERFEVHRVRGSCGTIYESCVKIEKSYKEALAVLDIKEKFPEETKSIYYYQDLGIYQFLEAILEKRRDDGYENQSLKKLREYDQKHNTEFLPTLEVYLDKDSNINETAKTLHIHANTLNYRLKRITEIGQINLKDPNQKITIYIDIKIEKIKNKGLL